MTRAQRGFTLIEVVIAMLVLAIAILTQLTATIGEHRLSVEERFRSVALQAADQIIQRLRAEEDWGGLYGRLRSLREDAETPGALGTGQTRLDDGRRAFVPETYFPEFVLPPALTSAHVLIDVPSALLDEQPELGPVLREDVVQPGFGLPSDLNLDGALDGAARDGDHLVLPVRIVLRWSVQGEAPRELKVPAWIRGTR